MIKQKYNLNLSHISLEDENVVAKDAKKTITNNFNLAEKELVLKKHNFNKGI